MASSSFSCRVLSSLLAELTGSSTGAAAEAGAAEALVDSLGLTSG